MRMRTDIHGHSIFKEVDLGKICGRLPKFRIRAGTFLFTAGAK